METKVLFYVIETLHLSLDSHFALILDYEKLKSSRFNNKNQNKEKRRKQNSKGESFQGNCGIESLKKQQYNNGHRKYFF